MAKKDEIKLEHGDVIPAFLSLKELIGVNENPFRANAQRLIYDLQSEVKFIQGCKDEDLEALKGREINLGEKIPAPQHYPDEYYDILSKLCKGLKKKTSMFESLIKTPKAEA